MTKQEFISKVQAYKNISGKGAMIAVSSVLVLSFFIVGGCALISYIRDHLQSLWVANAATVVIGIVLLFVVMLSFQLLVRSIKLKLLRLELVCPDCGSLFLGQTARAVISTGSCARCGKKILDEKADA